MRFALLEGKRVEAKPKLRATCPSCQSEVLAKCGKYLKWHWAHKSKTHCDPWWETEGEWHRNWKSHFPEEWQEIVCVDSVSGELHIADIKTPSGLVIEFQRSSISPEEVKAREDYYNSMIWVIDGCKNDFDKYNFATSRSQLSAEGFAYFSWFGRSQIFKRWHTAKPVFIDFGAEHGFWRIYQFDPITKKGLVGLVDIGSFVNTACSGTTDFSSGGGPASLIDDEG